MYKPTTMVLSCVLIAAGSLACWAQQTAHRVDVRSGTVVYVSGQDLVVKTENGTVKHFVVPEDTIFTIDGKDLHVDDLKPGMTLTQTITTTSADRTVTNVRTVDAKVWKVLGPTSMVVTLPDGTNKQVKVPDGTKFKINGEEKTVLDLRPGMQLSGTIVTDAPETVVSQTSQITGHAPPTPQIIGVLLFAEPQN